MSSAKTTTRLKIFFESLPDDRQKAPIAADLAAFHDQELFFVSRFLGHYSLRKDGARGGPL